MCLEVLTMTDGRVFARPDEFLPERWTTEPELVIDSSAFIPFNSGTSYNLEFTTSFQAFTRYVFIIHSKKIMLTIFGDRSILLRRKAACSNGA